MSDKQPEALRLADEIDRVYGYPDTNAAATELRRLHEVNQELQEALEEALKALEEALKLIELVMPIEGDVTREARAAIAKATGDEA